MKTESQKKKKIDNLLKDLEKLQESNRTFVSVYEIYQNAKDDYIDEIMKEITWKIATQIQSYVEKYRFELENTAFASEHTILLETNHFTNITSETLQLIDKACDITNIRTDGESKINNSDSEK